MQRHKPVTRTHWILFVLSLLSLWLSFSETAHALPSFSRQTGMACTTCHTQAFGPNLTPMGRDFKLRGYTSGGNDSLLSRFGGMIEGSFTNTSKDDPSIPVNNPKRDFNANNNLALDQASIFYGGKVIGPMGALVQFTYDGVASRFALDNTDIRISNDTDLLGKNLVYGVSFNNNPTTQDLWNTTPAWSFPYTGSPLAATPGAGPVIANIGSQVGGATLYTMIDDTVFLEAGAYTSFAKYAQQGMGQWDGTQDFGGVVKIDGGAPYWRIALQKQWQGHYFSLGHFGFRANVQPNTFDASGTARAPGADRYTDLGMDFNYQYLADPKNIYEFKASYIREQQELFSTFNYSNGSQFFEQQQGFLGLNGSYTYDQTYSLTVGYNHIHGNADNGLYPDSPRNKPNSEYYTFELDYVPFGKTASAGLQSYLNMRIALQYVAYTQFDGADKNYAGPGRDASDNNTFYVNSWLIF